MHTSKFLLAGLLTAVFASAPNAPAQDSAAQIKAREALNQRLNELNTQQPAPAPANPQPKPAAPATQPKPAVAAPAPQTRTAPRPTPAPATTTPAPAPQVARAPSPAPIQPAPVTAVEAPAEDPAAVAAREAALRKAMDKDVFGEVPPPSSTGKVTASQVEAAPARPATVAATPASPAPKPTKVAAPRPSAFVPLEAPALPMNTDKQSRLDDLLRRYRSDEITPEQYHTERARILAGP